MLADPGPHLRHSYRPTGPTLISTAEFAEILSRILGRRIRYVDVPFAILAKAAGVVGFDDYTVAQLRWYTEELKAGTFAVGAPTDAVEKLTARAPEDMETIARRYLATTPGTTRGPSGMARAMTVLTKTMLHPAPSQKRYLAAYQDGVAFGTLAADSEQWHATHDPDRRLRPVPPKHAAPTVITELAR